MGEGKGVACGKLPLPIGICPTCGHGVKVSRGFTWIDPAELFGDVECGHNGIKNCNHLCHLSTYGVHKMHNAGMIWVGERYYNTPESFNLEAMTQGVSRRINSIPHQFELGKTWIFLAHRKGHTVETIDDHLDGVGGERITIDQSVIFHVFLPTAIEYVVKPDDDEDKLTSLVKKGCTLVRIERLDEQGEIMFATEAHRMLHRFQQWLKGSDNVNQ